MSKDIIIPAWKPENIIICNKVFDEIQYCNGNKPSQRLMEFYGDNIPDRETMKVRLVTSINKQADEQKMEYVIRELKKQLNKDE
jgi:hypothetical protein